MNRSQNLEKKISEYKKLIEKKKYENETMLSEAQVKLDSQSRYVNNASKIIFVDTPNVDNKMNYIGRLS